MQPFILLKSCFIPLGICAILTLLFFGLQLPILGVLSLICCAIIIRIFYNPERIAFERGDNVFLAPIDGVVQRIEQKDGITSIFIYSSFFSVGVLRLPFEGELQTKRIKGLSFYNPKFCSSNAPYKPLSERVLLHIDSKLGKIACIVYPLFCAKSLQLWLPNKADSLQKGQRLGFLPCGVVEIRINSPISLRVCEGDRIYAAYNVIGIFASCSL